MTERIHIQNLLRLTLTRKGRAIAKHPLLREGVIEAVKASQASDSSADSSADPSDDPLWETPETDDAAHDDGDWYGDFAAFIATVPAEDIPESWEEAFASEEFAVKAGTKAGTKKPNYPTSRGPFAGPHNSFPIKTQQDVYDAARLIGHATNKQAVKERIIRIAHSRGFQLPKSWRRGQTHATKSQKSFGDSMDEQQFEELVTRLSERLNSATSAPVAPADEVEKAKSTMHSHEHNHSTQRGYGYSHTHDHGHESMVDHETSEAAHGHEHVSKASDAASEATSEPNVDALVADVAGLDADLKAKVAEFETLKAEHEALKAQLAEKAKVADEVEAVKAELQSAVDAAKQPLIAGVPQTTEKAKLDPKSMSFDDAFTAILHS